MVGEFPPAHARHDHVGQQEVDGETVALQNQAGEKLGSLDVDDMLAQLLEEIAEKRLPGAAIPPTA